MTGHPYCWSRQSIGGAERHWGCRRVLVAGQWRASTRAERQAGHPAICPTCLHLLQAAQRRAQARMERQLLRERAQGYGPAPEGVDPFREF